METKFRLMVIDDRWNDRKEYYETVLSSFEIVPVIEGKDMFDMIQNEKVDGYLIDMVLTKWINSYKKPQELMPVLEAIGYGKPIALVSSQYEKMLKDGELTAIITDIISKGFLVNYFFLWSDFEIEAQEKKKYNNEGGDGLADYTQNIENILRIYLSRQKEINRKKEENTADIGIICALEKEMEPVLALLEKVTTEPFGNGSLKRGFITTGSGKRIRVVAAIQQEMGNVNAAFVSLSLVRRYKIKHLFMTGVCGGRDGKVKIGDIVIPHEICAYQGGRIEEKGFLLESNIAKSNVQTRVIFGNNCDAIGNDIRTKYFNKLFQSKKESIAVDVPQINFNEMACGDSIVDKPEELDRIAKEAAKRKLCAVDMESYAIYKLNEIADVKTLVIKSVMDLASDKSNKYKEYACFVSANFLIEILKREIYHIDN